MPFARRNDQRRGTHRAAAAGAGRRPQMIGHELVNGARAIGGIVGSPRDAGRARRRQRRAADDEAEPARKLLVAGPHASRAHDRREKYGCSRRRRRGGGGRETSSARTFERRASSRRVECRATREERVERRSRCAWGTPRDFDVGRAFERCAAVERSRRAREAASVESDGKDARATRGGGETRGRGPPPSPRRPRRPPPPAKRRARISLPRGASVADSRTARKTRGRHADGPTDPLQSFPTAEPTPTRPRRKLVCGTSGSLMRGGCASFGARARERARCDSTYASGRAIRPREDGTERREKRRVFSRPR